MSYYDGTKLLSLKDINGEQPEIYICTSNRTAGKSTYFNRLVVNRFLNRGEKFMLLYRWNYELDNVANKFFKDINGLFFPNSTMTEMKRQKGTYVELFLDNVSCGYAVSLNSADQLKKLSHFFSDTGCMLFDEFQPESGQYCDKEIDKFYSIHTTVARGKNKQVRYVPVFMVSNPISIINPYYVDMGISTRLKMNTKFLKGSGFVLEQGYNESAKEALESSGFAKAFAKSEYGLYAQQGVYLNDSMTFIEKPQGKPKYFCTIRYENVNYGIRLFDDTGIVYADNHADNSFPVKLSVTTADHGINYVMLRCNEYYVRTMRYYFDHGCFRFKDLKAKEAVMKALSY